MMEYIINDMTSVMRFLPYGIGAGVIAALLFGAVNKRRMNKGKNPVSVASVTAFFMYAAIILVITFWSREEGSRNVKIDLDLFSTWGINARNNAFVIENVLLFIPFGFVSAWCFKAMRNFFACGLFGLAVSVGIECLQLVTGRGFFQLDDILTNALGTLIGYLVFRCFWRKPA